MKKKQYIIQYPKGKCSVSFGILRDIYEDKNYEFIHKCSTENGSSGSPILNLNNKLIGIHKKGNKKENKGTFLNYPLKEFIQKYSNEKLLEKFNKNYKKSVKDINIQKIVLDIMDKGDNILKDLCQIEFKELKELYLYNNDISDIKVLEKIKFKKLEELDLSRNKISDINILEKVNFKKLKKLDLYNNNISDIKILEKVKFEKLEELVLGENEISNINILEKLNF